MLDSSVFVIGETVRFRIDDPHDNVLYTGTVEGICGYSLAKRYGSLEQTNSRVCSSTGASYSVSNLEYVVLSVEENSGSTVTKVFAIAWITDSTFEVVEANTYKLFKVYDISDDTATAILEAIVSMGYTAEITT